MVGESFKNKVDPKVKTAEEDWRDSLLTVMEGIIDEIKTTEANEELENIDITADNEVKEKKTGSKTEA